VYVEILVIPLKEVKGRRTLEQTFVLILGHMLGDLWWWGKKAVAASHPGIGPGAEIIGN